MTFRSNTPVIYDLERPFVLLRDSDLRRKDLGADGDGGHGRVCSSEV